MNDNVNAIDCVFPREFKASSKWLLPGVDRFYRCVQRSSSSAVWTIRLNKGVLQGRLFRFSQKYDRAYWVGFHLGSI